MLIEKFRDVRNLKWPPFCPFFIKFHVFCRLCRKSWHKNNRCHVSVLHAKFRNEKIQNGRHFASFSLNFMYFVVYLENRYILLNPYSNKKLSTHPNDADWEISWSSELKWPPFCQFFVKFHVFCRLCRKSWHKNNRCHVSVLRAKFRNEKIQSGRHFASFSLNFMYFVVYLENRYILLNPYSNKKLSTHPNDADWEISLSSEFKMAAILPDISLNRDI